MKYRSMQVQDVPTELLIFELLQRHRPIYWAGHADYPIFIGDITSNHPQESGVAHLKISIDEKVLLDKFVAEFETKQVKDVMP